MKHISIYTYIYTLLGRRHVSANMYICIHIYIDIYVCIYIHIYI